MSKYAVIRRRYDADSESNKYEIINTDEKFSVALSKADKYTGDPGDILIVCDLNDVSDITKKAKTMFVVGHDGKSHNVPDVEQMTGRDSASWITLLEEDVISLEGMFWVCFDCGVENYKLLSIVGECVSLAVLGSEIRDKLEPYINSWKAGAINSEEVTNYVEALIDLRDKNISRENEKAINALLYLIKSISDFTYAPSALTAAQQCRVGNNIKCLDIFRSRISTSELLMSLVKRS